MPLESRLIKNARAATQAAEDERAAVEFVEWLLFALELPEVRDKIRALVAAPPPTHPHRAGGRGAPRRRSQ